jgi:ABC-type dipeptide/oligopeptide/nickel transport system permease component
MNKSIILFYHVVIIGLSNIAVAQQWQARHNLSESQYQNVFNELSGQGVVPYEIAVVNSNNQVKCSCVWRQEILLFAVQLGWLPAGGVTSVGADTLKDRLIHLILPVLTLTILTVGGVLRFTRSAMLETLRQDYVRTAYAKGLGAAEVVLRHALRNAMIPIVTVVALHFGALFSGALIVETMFAYLGMGKLIYDSIIGNDFNVALVGLLFATILTLASNLGADVVYAWLDPRISYDE